MIKQSKESTDYTNSGSKTEHCSNCTHYLNPTTCEVVVGKIVPGGWCKLWKKGT
jgi:High potential iron-sulfur protein